MSPPVIRTSKLPPGIQTLKADFEDGTPEQVFFQGELQ